MTLVVLASPVLALTWLVAPPPIEPPPMVSPEVGALDEAPEPPPAVRVEPPAESEAGEAAREAAETEADPEDHPWVAGGIVDAAYIFNSNRPDNHVYRGAFTTPRTGEFTINVAGAFLEHRAKPSGGWTMQVGLHAGAAVDAVYAVEPRPGGDDSANAGPEVFKHVALANAGFRFRTGTDLGMGVFSSPIGIGGLWGTGNWLYSSSWQSNWVPYYLSGLRLSQELPKDLRLEAWVVSGWQTVSDVNAAPSGLVALYWEPSQGLAEGAWVAGHLYAGPETQSLAVEDWQVAASVQAGFDKPRAGVAWVWDGGRGRIAGSGGDIGLYTGGAMFTRIRLLGRPNVRLDLNARPEVWWDPDGFTYGRPGTLAAGALGLSVHAYDALIVRLEYRYDHSTASLGSFYEADRTNDNFALENDQHTLFLNVTGHYELAFGKRRPRKR